MKQKMKNEGGRNLIQTSKDFHRMLFLNWV